MWCQFVQRIRFGKEYNICVSGFKACDIATGVCKTVTTRRRNARTVADELEAILRRVSRNAFMTFSAENTLELKTRERSNPDSTGTVGIGLRRRFLPSAHNRFPAVSLRPASIFLLCTHELVPPLEALSWIPNLDGVLDDLA
jgi:hypothetical protein